MPRRAIYRDGVVERLFQVTRPTRGGKDSFYTDCAYGRKDQHFPRSPLQFDRSDLLRIAGLTGQVRQLSLGNLVMPGGFTHRP